MPPVLTRAVPAFWTKHYLTHAGDLYEISRLEMVPPFPVQDFILNSEAGLELSGVSLFLGPECSLGFPCFSESKPLAVPAHHHLIEHTSKVCQI
jgi:hypothetical protein